MAGKDLTGEIHPATDRFAPRTAPALHPLHEAALKLAGMGSFPSKGRTRELVAMLLSHGARAWRSGQPRVRMHLHVTAPSGRHPVRLRIG